MNSPRFNRAVSALLGAYLNDTLLAADCRACAVGNMVAVGYGLKVYRNHFGKLTCDKPNNCWSAIFCSGVYRIDAKSSEDYNDGLDNIAATGYSVDELRQVEYAFMTPHDFGYWAQNLGDNDDRNYRGLMACIDVLCQIEGITDPAPYKAQFDKSLPLEVA